MFFTDAETYVNPQTNIPANVGVVMFVNTTAVNNYFDRLNVPKAFFNPLTDVPAGTPATLTYDLSSGFPIPAQNSLAVQQQYLALLSAGQNYNAKVLSKYPWIDQGFLVPEPVPEELLLSFGELAAQLGFSPLLPIIAQWNFNSGNISTLPALYGIKIFGPALFGSFFDKFILSASGNTRTLYEAAAQELGDSVLLDSTIVEVHREATYSATRTTGVTILVEQPGQASTLVRARKLLVAIPQTIKNIGEYDLSDDERRLFSNFQGLGNYAGIVNVQGLNNSIANVGISTPFNQPVIPGTAGLFATGSPGDYMFTVGFNDLDYNDATAQAIIRDSLTKLATTGVVPQDAAQAATFPFTSDHGPYSLRVPVDEIKNGFYSKIAAAQGKRNTYWAGAAFAGHNSGLVWAYNEGTVIPGLKKDLGL